MINKSERYHDTYYNYNLKLFRIGYNTYLAITDDAIPHLFIIVTDQYSVYAGQGPKVLLRHLVLEVRPYRLLQTSVQLCYIPVAAIVLRTFVDTA